MEIDTPALALLGALLVIGVLADVVWTTIGVGSGRGPLSDRVAHLVWRAGRVGRAGHRRLQVLGVVVAIAVPAAWVVLTWLGFALLFLSDDDAVLVAVSQEPTTALGRVAYAAGGLAGAGAALVAGTETWALVTNVSALVGLGLLTLSLTYLFQVVSAVAAERSALSRLASLGPSPAETVRAALQGEDLGTLPWQLTTTADAVSRAAQQHLALPLLQFFHSPDASASTSLNLARFNEVLDLLEHGLQRSLAPTVSAGRQAVDGFLATLRLGDPSPEAPPLPPLDPLREVADDVVDDDAFATAMAAEEPRRERLHAFLAQDGWTWDDVSAAPSRNG